MRELSLLKGDVVKIYTKMSANGWWRGEVNGRVSVPLNVFIMYMKGAGQPPAPMGRGEPLHYLTVVTPTEAWLHMGGAPY